MLDYDDEVVFDCMNIMIIQPVGKFCVISQYGLNDRPWSTNQADSDSIRFSRSLK